jgi:hypothetical protein
MSQRHHWTDSAQESNDAKILSAQAEGQLNMALKWLGKDDLVAARVFLGTVKKLLTLSGDINTNIWINYYYACATVAQKGNQWHGALRHCRKALSLTRRLYPSGHCSVLVAQANVGESLAALGQKDKGRAMVAASLEKLKAADVGTEAHMISWKETALEELTQTLNKLS